MSLTVVKLSGKICDSDQSLRSVAVDVCRLVRQGQKIVLIHGGGRQLDELAARLAIPQVYSGGRRITCAETLSVAMMVLGGSVNVRVTAALRAAGLSPVGLSGIDGGLIRAVKRSATVDAQGATVDWGFVGDLEGGDPGLLFTLLERGDVPVISSLSCDDDGTVLNVNADTFAAEIAVLLNADGMISLSDTNGIYQNISDPTSRLASLNLAECQAFLADGGAQGGMLPKLAGVIKALERGVPKVHLIDGLAPEALFAALQMGTAVGTTITTGNAASAH